ncbi:MAG TPA: glutathione S-transferase C-terminal domain-containing protein [Solirubrobacteraceae bacterium]|nr:glutathione S-transferase C-terminal domain-containing protein [Solirubrobacteraceae bacterium]
MSSSTRFSIDAETRSGQFQRQQSRFRGWVSEPVAGRYHLYVALACPWSQRVAIVRKLKGLEDAISISYAAPYRDERGWAFPGGAYVDDLHGWEFLSAGYEQTEPGFEGRVTVPVLWDKEAGRIVSNESQDIVRMLNADFNAVAGVPELDLYPEALREEIDALNDRVYDTVNNGVYRVGFSTSQEAYDQAFAELFASLAWLEELLGERRYLAGDVITEADWRLWVTLLRFDPVYYVHFRCNGRRLIDHPNLWAYARELHQQPSVRETVAMEQIKEHYYTTHDMLNPKRIIPAGPLDLDWDQPHGRG